MECASLFIFHFLISHLFLLPVSWSAKSPQIPVGSRDLDLAVHYASR
jgi:hypothetical protein